MARTGVLLVVAASRGACGRLSEVRGVLSGGSLAAEAGGSLVAEAGGSLVADAGGSSVAEAGGRCRKPGGVAEASGSLAEATKNISGSLAKICRCVRSFQLCGGFKTLPLCAVFSTVRWHQTLPLHGGFKLKFAAVRPPAARSRCIQRREEWGKARCVQCCRRSSGAGGFPVGISCRRSHGGKGRQEWGQGPAGGRRQEAEV